MRSALAAPLLIVPAAASAQSTVPSASSSRGDPLAFTVHTPATPGTVIVRVAGALTTGADGLLAGPRMVVALGTGEWWRRARPLIRRLSGCGRFIRLGVRAAPSPGRPHRLSGRPPRGAGPAQPAPPMRHLWPAPPHEAAEPAAAITASSSTA